MQLSADLNAHNHLSGGILLKVALAMYDHDYDEAHEQLQQAMQISEQQANAWFKSLILFYQASLAYFDGQPQQAITHLQNTHQYLEQEPVIRNKVLSKLGYLYFEIGDSTNGNYHLQQALDETLKNGQLPTVLDVLVGYAHALQKTNYNLSQQLISFVSQQSQISHIETYRWLEQVKAQIFEASTRAAKTNRPHWTSIKEAVDAIRDYT